MEIRDKVRSYLPAEMNDVREEFYHERQRSFKPLIDTTFAGMTFDEAAWDMLDSDEKKNDRKCSRVPMNTGSHLRLFFFSSECHQRPMYGQSGKNPSHVFQPSEQLIFPATLANANNNPLICN